MKRTNNKTKIVATLGVVAGLGLAAFPALSYATTSVSGNVKVEAEVAPAIAMRIHSNADQNCADTDSDPTTPDVCTNTYGFIGYNPAEAQGPTDPAATAAGAASQATGLSLSSNQADSTSLYSNIEVRSNTGKFKLEVQDADADTAMRNNSGSTTTNEYIPAGITTATDQTTGDTIVDPTVAGWALKGGELNSWSAVPASTGAPLTIASNGTNTTSPLSYSDSLTVNYAVASGLTKTGVYSDTITYTATSMDTPVDPFAICGENEGDECTVAGTDYVRLKDGNLWTKNSQGQTTWDNLSSVSCPSGTSKPTAAAFQTLVNAYGGIDDSYYGTPYGTRSNDTSDLYNATGWSGPLFWSTTEYDSGNAWYMYASGTYSLVYQSVKSASLHVICYHQ